MNTGSYLTASAIFSIGAAFGYNFSSSPNISEQWRVFWFVIAVAFTSLVALSVISIFWENTSMVGAIADAIVKVQDPAGAHEIALGGLIARMNPAQLIALQNQQPEVVYSEFAIVIRQNGIEMDAEWLNGHLAYLEAFAPEFGAIRRDRDSKEMACLDWFVGMGWAKKRPGQVAVWIGEHSPQTARKFLGLED